MAVNAQALTTRDRLISFMGLTGLSSSDNTVLDLIIDSVTDFAEHYCGRRFKETTYTSEVYDGTDTPTLLLKQYPVNSSSTFLLQERNTIDNTANWSDVNSKNYFVDYSEGIISLAIRRDSKFSSLAKFRNYPQAYRVTYTAGFAFDNSSVFPSDVGLADLEYAVWRLGALLWNRRKGDPGVSSESVGDYSVTYTKFTMETPEIKSILDKYARLDYV